jgi:hypothetical protein
MKVRTTLAWAGLALVVGGSALAPNGQAETVTPKVDEAVPRAFITGCLIRKAQGSDL